MFGLLLKTGTYYILWNKFKGQFAYIFVSLVVIVLTLWIYDDLYTLIKITDKESLWVILLVKYCILILIAIVNFYHFKNIKVPPLPKQEIKKDEKIILEPIEEEIIKKKTLKTKSDFILEKYASKYDV